MANDFGFDELGGFESGISTDDIDNSSTTESNGFGDFGDFGNTGTQPSNTGSASGDKKSVIKTASIAIGVSVVIIISAFAVMSMMQHSAAKPSSSTTAVKQASVSNQNITGNSPVVLNNSPVVTAPVSVASTSNWKEFSSSSRINFNANYIDSIFTVVSVKNYVEVVDNENNLMVKTIVSGSLSGFIGTYELELPYSKGSQLLTGNNFSVKVQLGKYDDKVVVGEVKY